MPRKVTDSIVSAFINGRSAKQGNTSTDGNALYLHGNKIAKMENGELWISNAGWFSNTTKERLNGIPGVSVYQKNGKWVLNGVPWDGKWIKVGNSNQLESEVIESSSNSNVVDDKNFINYVIDYENGDLDEDGRIALFSYLLKTGKAWHLQGTYARAARSYINAGILSIKGDVLTGDEVSESVKVQQKVKSLLRKLVKEEIHKVLNKKKINESTSLPTGMLQQYLDTAIWSSTDDEGRALDRDYTVKDISPESVERSKKDLQDFMSKAKRWLPSDVNLSDVAHDFWLSRNGHGAGFFDASYVEGHPRKMLQTIAGTFKEINVVVGDDGKIHFE